MYKVKSLVTKNIFNESKLYTRTVKHVDDEVWADGRIPVEEVYNMTEVDMASKPGTSLYMLDSEQNVYEPVEVLEDLGEQKGYKVEVDGGNARMVCNAGVVTVWMPKKEFVNTVIADIRYKQTEKAYEECRDEDGHSDDLRQYSTEEDVGYLSFSIDVLLHGIQICSPRVWVIVGWLPPGDETDLDGRYVKNPNGRWSCCDRDETEYGTEELIRETVSALAAIGLSEENGFYPEDLIRDDVASFLEPKVREPTNETIFSNLPVVEDGDENCIVAGKWLGTYHLGVKFDGKFELETHKPFERSSAFELAMDYYKDKVLKVL